MDKPKKTHLELLRLLAVYLVVLTHTGKRGYTYFTTLEPSLGYYVSMLVPVVCNLAVPLFYMISGATLLDKEEPCGYILRRRLPRHLIVLVLASALMYVYYGTVRHTSMTLEDFLRRAYSQNIIIPYWFLYSYVGFLLLLPFLRRLIRGLTDREWNYLLGLYLVFNGIVPILQFRLYGGNLSLNASLNVTMVTGDILIYPALGYHLEHSCLSLKKLCLLWLYALAAVCVTIYMTHYKILLTGEMDEGRVGTFYKSLRFIPAAAVYASAKNLRSLPRGIEKTVCVMGGCSFGVYLFEQVLREEGYPICDKMSQYLPPLTATLIYTAIVVVAGMIVVWLLKLVPGVNKLI